MNDEKIVDKVMESTKPVAWMGVDNEGNPSCPNKFQLGFFRDGIPLFADPAASAMNAEPVAWMGVDNEGHPNKFRLDFFSGGIPLFAAPAVVRRLVEALDGLLAMYVQGYEVCPITIKQAQEAIEAVKEIIKYEPNSSYADMLVAVRKNRAYRGIWQWLDF